jgi:hypothetical protein
LRWSLEPLTRLQVVAIWAFIALLLLITRSETAWLLFKIASAAAAAFFLWPFTQGPYLLYTRHIFPLHENFRVVPGETDPSPQGSVISDLQTLGFAFAGQLVQDPEKRNVAVRLDILIHPQNQDSAQVAEVVSGLSKHYLLIFKARFDDGFAFETSRGYTPSPFKPNPNYQVFRFPQLRSTADLYRLHRKIKKQRLPARSPTMGDGAGELAEFIEHAETAHRRHAHSGHYKLAPSGEHYVYTWSGAVRHAWLHAWPIKRFRTIRIYSRADKMARELGFRIDPKRGRLEELQGRVDRN